MAKTYLVLAFIFQCISSIYFNHELDISKISSSPSEGIINVFIQIPKGSRAKYEFNQELGILVLDRVLYSYTSSPQAYGFIPNTLSGDGDPLDVLVICSIDLLPNTLVRARPIGILEMIDGGQRDQKILAVASEDPFLEYIGNIDDVSPHELNAISQYYKTYKKLQNKQVQLLGWKGKTTAEEQIQKAIQAGLN